jgi:NADH-quinone oxidoreductase subunit N
VPFLLAAEGFARPVIDWHAFAPEIVLTGVICLLVLVDSFTSATGKWAMPSIAGLGLLGTAIPLLTLVSDGTDRSMFGGAYMVDDFAIALKLLFVVSAYVVVLLANNYIAEGDYWEGEFYTMLLASVLGMLVMASARDLITIFVALELLSIPAYLLATWRKRDPRSNEAGLKYYLMGVFATAVLLYGMSLLYGVSGSTLLTDIAETVKQGEDSAPIVSLAIVFVVIGFAFKVSAVPFHTWAPDTYEGAPTPVTAFLAVASKTAGFVALMQLVVVGLLGRGDVYEPLLWALSVASMTVGNLIALRQENLVRMLAYSGIAQAGYMLAPLAVASHDPNQAVGSIVSYLIIYAAMNLGAFAVVIAAARTTRSAELRSFNGLFQYAPGLTVMMTIFLFSLAGIPPLGGWFAKFQIFYAVIDAQTTAAYALAVIVGLNSVIALYYYARVAKAMWFEDPAEDVVRSTNIPVAVRAAIGLCAIATLVTGVLPGLVGHVTDTVGLLALP